MARTFSRQAVQFMRTFPKELAEIRRVVDARGEALRALSYDELVAASKRPIESLKIGQRVATIGIIVQEMPGKSLRIVVQGFMATRWIPGKNVALDGFYKMPDGSVKPMSNKDFNKFG